MRLINAEQLHKIEKAYDKSIYDVCETVGNIFPSKRGKNLFSIADPSGVSIGYTEFTIDVSNLDIRVTFEIASNYRKSFDGNYKLVMDQNIASQDPDDIQARVMAAIAFGQEIKTKAGIE